MKTEKEKMLACEAFNTSDFELMENKKNARILAEQYNSSEEDSALRKSILKKLFGKCGENIMIKPPFHCDYGHQIFIGENFFANFDCIFLDAAPIEIGDNCMIGPKTCIYAISHPLAPEERKNSIGIPQKVIEDHTYKHSNHGRANQMNRQQTFKPAGKNRHTYR